jgi:hypothetical protein
MANNDGIDKIVEQIEQHVQATFPAGVSVPTGASDDEALRAIREQFTRAGYDCPEDTARTILEEAKKQQQ